MTCSNTVRDIMTKKVVSVYPDTPLLEANTLIQKNQFSGIPVVDRENRLVGMLTGHDLISSEAALHLPTVQKLIGDLPVYRKDRDAVDTQIEALRSLTVKDVMHTDSPTLLDDASVTKAIALFRDNCHVNPVAIVDKDRRLVGVISRYDLLSLISVNL